LKTGVQEEDKWKTVVRKGEEPGLVQCKKGGCKLLIMAVYNGAEKGYREEKKTQFIEKRQKYSTGKHPPYDLKHKKLKILEGGIHNLLSK